LTKCLTSSIIHASSFSLGKKEKKKGGEISYLLIYCCPGGACPAGFVAGVGGFCVNPSPWQFGCCPGGRLPLGFSQDGGCAGVILAWTGAATDETIMATDSATAMAASAANVTLCVFMSRHTLSFI
jgi:hypothetical protein